MYVNCRDFVGFLRVQKPFSFATAAHDQSDLKFLRQPVYVASIRSQLSDGVLPHCFNFYLRFSFLVFVLIADKYTENQT
jgi:hypothetical protein